LINNVAPYYSVQRFFTSYILQLTYLLTSLMKNDSAHTHAVLALVPVNLRLLVTPPLLTLRASRQFHFPLPPATHRILHALHNLHLLHLSQLRVFSLAPLLIIHREPPHSPRSTPSYLLIQVMPQHPSVLLEILLHHPNRVQLLALVIYLLVTHPQQKQAV